MIDKDLFNFVHRLDYRHNVDIQVVAEKHVSVIASIIIKSTFYYCMSVIFVFSYVYFSI